MKHSQTIILAAVAAAVLLTALGVGFYVREARQKNRAGGPRVGAESVGEESGGSLVPGRVGRERFSNLSEEERAKVVEERKKIAEGRANMSEEEKEKFRQQLRERFNARRRGERERLPALSPEEGAKLRERWANMSEQEREEYRSKMRKEYGAVRGEPNAVQQEPNAIRQEQ